MYRTESTVPVLSPPTGPPELVKFSKIGFAYPYPSRCLSTLSETTVILNVRCCLFLTKGCTRDQITCNDRI
jgi:hypothetical protein